MSSARLGHIIGRIYEAAEDPKVWLDVLRLLGKTLRSTNNVFVLNDAASLGGAISLSEGTDPKFDRDYNSYYHSVNTILDGLQGRFSPGKILASTDACGDDDLVKTEYYQDFLRPHDLFYFIGGTISQTATSNSLISLGRSHKLGPWTAVEKQTIQFLMPHFQRAAQLAGKFAIIQQERDYLLNRLIMGVIILNERGTVEFLNGAAELLLKKKDGLYWGANGICAVDHAESARLHYMISTAKSNASPRGGAAGGSLSIRRSSLSRPLLVSVAPIIRKDASRLSESSHVAIFITDPDATPSTNLARFITMFGLTPAESRVAGQLLQGKSVAETADWLGITLQTARVHLKRIFSKTYTRRQSELMRLLLTSAAWLRD